MPKGLGGKCSMGRSVLRPPCSSASVVKPPRRGARAKLQGRGGGVAGFDRRFVVSSKYKIYPALPCPECAAV